MAAKNSFITVTDQFCGAGGSSQGVRNLAKRHNGGLEVKLALNHWQLAIDTHSTNFPETIHDCTDVSACDPRRYPSTDVLITSPECTTHSPAGGNNHKSLKKQMDLFETGVIDPATERSRATMWDVCRFAEYHSYNCIIVENVVEAKTRWPLFDVWLQAMHTLGYNHKCVYLNSMHCHPTPQSRDRMYVVFWKKGNKAPNLEITPVAFCGKCQKNVESIQTWKNTQKQYGKYRQQYVYCCPSCTSVVEPYYYAAFNIIDWSNRGVRIGDKKLKKYDQSFNGSNMLPLAPNTMKRVEHGIDKYGNQPMIIHRAYGNEARGVWRSASEPCFTQATGESQALINPPFIINDQHSTGIGFRVREANEYISTISCTPHMKLVVPPFIIKGEHSLAEPQIRQVGDTVQTQVCRQTMSVCMPPFMLEMYSGGKSRDVNNELNTVTAGGIKTGIVSNESFNSFLAYNYNGTQTSHITEATDAVTCKDKMSLVTYQKPSIEDCYYRMLTHNEIKLAMAFDTNYKILGSAKDIVKQCGNAVTPPAMELLIERVVNSLN